MLRIKKSYCFDDVLLVPKLTNIKSRDEIDLSVDLGKGIKLNIPITSANMKTVTQPKLAAQMCYLGGLGILHRYPSSACKYIQCLNWQHSKAVLQLRLREFHSCICKANTGWECNQ